MTDGLSVIVANDRRSLAEVEEASAALAGELIEGLDQIVWVDRAGLRPRIEVSEYLQAAATAGRGDLYGLGWKRATQDLAVFTDSTTVLLPGWRSALVEAFQNGAHVVGGPVVPLMQPGLMNWAGFLAEYGHHAVAPFTSVNGDVSGNIVAYDRLSLDGVDGPLWKSVVDAELMKGGIQPVIVEGMRAGVTKTYTWAWFLGERARQGRSYASQRCASWSTGFRIVYAIAALGLPVVLLFRLSKQIRRDAEIGRWLWVSLPLIFLAMVSWAVGEALGALGLEGSVVGPF